MYKMILKRTWSVLVLLLMFVPTQAQYLRSSYFMDGTSARLQLNPGLQPYRGYFNVPVIGSLNVSASSNTLGIQDIIDVVDEGGDIYMNDKLFSRLKPDNTLNLNLNTDVLSFGWFKGKNFWSVNVGLRMDIGAGLNKGMFDFMRNVNNSGLDGLYGQSQQYAINNQRVRMKAYGEIGLGFSRRLNEKLTVGARVKGLLGLARAEVNIDKYEVDMEIPEMHQDGMELTSEDWYGKRFAYQASGNVMTTMKGSGLTFDQNGMVEDFEFEAKDFGLAGGGLGVDFGASYQITDQLTVSAAVLDLGFLKWNKKETRMGTVEGSDDVLIDANNYDQYIGGDFLSLERFDFEEKKDVDYASKTRLSSTVLLAAEYAFFNNKLSVGGLYTAFFAQPKTLNDVTLSVTYRPKNWFNVAASYSPILASGKSMGLALKLGPLFLGTDYMYFGNNSKSVNGFIGISIPMGKKRAAI